MVQAGTAVVKTMTERLRGRKVGRKRKSDAQHGLTPHFSEDRALKKVTTPKTRIPEAPKVLSATPTPTAPPRPALCSAEIQPCHLSRGGHPAAGETTPIRGRQGRPHGLLPAHLRPRGGRCGTRNAPLLGRPNFPKSKATCKRERKSTVMTSTCSVRTTRLRNAARLVGKCEQLNLFNVTTYRVEAELPPRA